MIEQVTHKQVVQTTMEVECNGIRVNYYQNPDAFEYTFHVLDDVPEYDAAVAVDEIVKAMMHQSYDHGAEWRQVGQTEYVAPAGCKFYHTFKVRFRIKDAW